MHPFFNEIIKYPELEKEVNSNFIDLPSSYRGNNKLKAILLGADPTNKGVKFNKGLIPLITVFGIGSEYEQYFFGLQGKNLDLLEISKEDLLIQNLCRNYFERETGENKKWSAVAELWIKYLKQEIDEYPNIPVLATAEKIIKVLTQNHISADLLYSIPQNYLPLWSDSLQREVYPLYRHPKYNLSIQSIYRNYLINKLS